MDEKMSDEERQALLTRLARRNDQQVFDDAENRHRRSSIWSFLGRHKTAVAVVGIIYVAWAIYAKGQHDEQEKLAEAEAARASAAYERRQCADWNAESSYALRVACGAANDGGACLQRWIDRSDRCGYF